MATVYKVLDTRDRNDLEASINELNNKVYDKEANLQNNIDELTSKHEDLKAYAENNKSLIDELTVDKISHDEVIDTLSSELAAADNEELYYNVPLSARQGGILFNRDQFLQTQINTNKDSINTEKTRATNAETGLDSRLQTVENDINTFLANADFTEAAKDTLREIQDYIDSDVEGAAQMTASINSEASRAQKAESDLNAAKINYTDIVDSVSTDYIEPAENNPYSSVPLSARAGSIAYNTAVTLFGNEKNRAVAAEEALSQAISNEETRATNAESALDTKIDTTMSNHNNDVHTPLNTRIDGIDESIETLTTAVEARVLKASIADDLTTTDAAKVLSAKQGNVLDTKKVNVLDIVNDLTTGGTAVPLSAEQGKVLNNNLSTIAEARILKASIADNLTTDDATKVLSARQGKLLNDNKINYSDIVNTLTADLATDETAANVPLSAAQGGILYNRTAEAIRIAGEKVAKTDIVDDLTTADATKVLSANQGAVLYGLIQELIERLDALDGGGSTAEETPPAEESTATEEETPTE